MIDTRPLATTRAVRAEIFQTVDREVVAAIGIMRAEAAESVTVTLTLKLSRDKKGALVADYTHRQTLVERGCFSVDVLPDLTSHG